MHSRLSICLALTFTGAAAQGRAQTPSGAEPITTVERFWAAAFAQDWDAAVALLHLPGMHRLRSAQLLMAQAAARARARTVEDLLRRDPEMPRAAAEYQLRREERIHRQFATQPFPSFYGVDSAAHLERLPLDSLSIRWLQAHDPAWLAREYHRLQGCPLPVDADSVLRPRKPRIYGALEVGADSAFVLFEHVWPPLPEPRPLERPPQIARLVKDGAQWRIVPTDELLQGFAGGFHVLSSRCLAPRPPA